MWVLQIRHELREHQADLADLMKMLRGNNGHDSLIVRFTLAERLMSDYADQMKHLHAQLERRVTEEVRGKWLAITAAVGVLGTIIGAAAKGFAP